MAPYAASHALDRKRPRLWTVSEKMLATSVSPPVSEYVKDDPAFSCRFRQARFRNNPGPIKTDQTSHRRLLLKQLKRSFDKTGRPFVSGTIKGVISLLLTA
jgi:hypothetical protein